MSENGIIVLTQEETNSHRKETFRYPTHLGSKYVNPLRGVDEKIKGIIAPFWADVYEESQTDKVFINK